MVDDSEHAKCDCQLSLVPRYYMYTARRQALRHFTFYAAARDSESGLMHRCCPSVRQSACMYVCLSVCRQNAKENAIFS